MKNLLPFFIQQRLHEETYEGSLPAHTMFMDISGFTPMTERLMQEGKEGAEILSAEINRLFTALIEAVYSRGGIITGFAGDAFTAIFDVEVGEKPLQILEAAQEIQQIFNDHGHAETRFGNFQLQVKVGLSSGLVQWGITGSGGARCYYFRGPAIDGCAQSEQHCDSGEIILDDAIFAKYSDDERPSVEAKAPGYHRFVELSVGTERSVAEALSFFHRNEQRQIYTETALEFFPRAAIEAPAGEFRNILCCFVSLRSPEDHDELDALAARLRELSDGYEGYFNNLDFGDKGGTALFVFGAPTSHEDDGSRAANFALEVRSSFGERVRIGLNYGTAFAGMIGSDIRCTYTVEGDAVNTAARLMTSAEWGEILTTAATAQFLGPLFACEDAGRREFKGKSEAIAVSKLTDRKEATFEDFDASLFVGREAELEELSKDFRTLLDDRRFAGVRYIYGEAGSGKSRFLHEVFAKYGAPDASGDRVDFAFTHADGILKRSMNPFVNYFVTQFGTHEIDDPVARRDAVDGRITALLGQIEAMPVPDDEHLRGHRETVLADLWRTRSLLGYLVDADVSGSLYEQLDVKGRFENTLIAIKEYFKALALIRPTVIVLEDLHWVDSDSLSVIENMLRYVDELPLLVLVSGRYRDDGTRPRLRLVDDVVVRSVELSALEPPAVQELAGHRLGGEIAANLLQFIGERTRGNPFYITEFCTYLQQNELLANQAGVLDLADTNVADIPASVNALVTARIDRLSLELKEAVQIAAVLGREFDVRVLGRLLGREDIASVLEQGRSEQIWAPTEIQDVCTFQNGLLQEVAYEMQLRDRLRGIHGRAAEILVERYGENPARAAEVAYHYEQAENDDGARRYYGLAADYAYDNYKSDKAQEFFDKLLDYAQDTDATIAILERKVNLLELTGRWDEALGIINDGLQLAGEDQQKAGEWKARMGEVYQKKGDYDRAATYLFEAANLGKALNADRLLADAHGHLGRNYWSTGRYDKALECFDEAVEANRRLNDRRGIALSQYYAGVVYRDRNEYDRAMQLYNDSLRTFEEIGDRRYATYPLYDIGIIHQYQGRLAEAREYFEKTEKLYAEIGYRSGSSATLLNLGVIEMRRGEYDKALEYFAHALSVAEEIGESMAVGYTLFSIGTAYYHLHRYDETLKHFQQAFTIMRKIGARGYYGYVFAYLTCTFARTNKAAKALHAALQHLKNIQELGGSDVENGRTHLGIALVLAQGGKFGPNARKLLDEIRSVTGLPDKADAYFEFAVQTARKAEYVMTLVPALREYGAYLAGRASRAPWFAERARDCLAEAHSLAQSMGLDGERVLIEEYAGSHGIEIG